MIYINIYYLHFQLYPDLLGEITLWNSSDPLGAILSINLFPHDGSVIVTQSESNRWVFSVIQSPLDYQHPVSGNREFGYIQNANGSYTRGVDRIKDESASLFRDGLVGISGFDVMDLADDLWESFQDNVYNYVNQHGGNSTLPPIRNQGKRPDWNKIKEFLEGEITLNELRNDC